MFFPKSYTCGTHPPGPYRVAKVGMDTVCIDDAVVVFALVRCVSSHDYISPISPGVKMV